MKVLVTGARGAIGRAVVSLGAARGATMLGLGHGAWTGDTDLPPLNDWINGDVSIDNLDRIRALAGLPDVVIHLAGGSHVGASIERPSEDFRRTVSGGQALLEWLRNNAPETRLVIASSAAVYGDTLGSPIAETSAYAPASPYGTHKAMVELLSNAYSIQYGLKVAVIRLFSVYGPGLRKQLVYDLFQRLRRGERDIILGGTGREIRDFLFIGDAAAMLLGASALATADWPVLNGGYGQPVSTAELARLVVTDFPEASVRFSGVGRKGDPSALVADVSRARALGLLAPTSLADGLAATRRWLDQVDVCPHP
ncbi:MAG: NAD-dependent epimerase/dehydratase family protein [Devosia sp.]|nr:NAD-dependent epimerase/dehydratase family protein [Devosia sp.]